MTQPELFSTPFADGFAYQPDFLNIEEEQLLLERIRTLPLANAQYKATPRAKSLAIELAPRSAYRMEGEARWGWQHRVPPVPALRYSITFRTLRSPTR